MKFFKKKVQPIGCLTIFMWIWVTFFTKNMLIR